MSEIIAIGSLKRNAAAQFSITLAHPSDEDIRVANPPVVAADVNVSTGGAAFSGLSTTPVVTPGGGVAVLVSLNASEMNAESVIVTFDDATGTEAWRALTIVIHTTVTDTDDLVRSTAPANTLDVSGTGEAGLDFDNIKVATGATTLTNITVPIVTTLTGHTNQTGDSFARLGAPAGASVSADLVTIDGVVDTILVDTAELQADWVNAGRLDTILDAILADTLSLDGTKIPDTLSLANINTEVDNALNTAIGGAPVADSINQRIRSLDLLLEASGDGDVAAILTDTGELQTDWENGGRLDLLIDSIIDTITGSPGVSLLLTQAITEGQTARTVGGSLEVSEAVERNRITVTGGNRTLFQSDGSTALVTRAQTATQLG